MLPARLELAAGCAAGAPAGKRGALAAYPTVPAKDRREVAATIDTR